MVGFTVRPSSSSAQTDILPKISSFTASPAGPVPPNTSIRLSWTVTTGFPKLCVKQPPFSRVTSIEVSSCWPSALVLGDNTTGFRDVVVNDTTQFILILPGELGDFIYQSVTVEVRADAPPPDENTEIPKILSFLVSQTQVTAGQSLSGPDLTWTTQNAQGATFKVTYSTVTATDKKPLPCLDGSSTSPCTLAVTSVANCTVDSCKVNLADFAKLSAMGTAPTARTTTFTLSITKGTAQPVTATANLTVNISGTDGSGGSGGGIVNSLLNLFASIFGAIITLLTTLIYWLFAYVIAPLIEAVLNIHPYQDIFVQVIYPGWLILRNLTNILFIIILLIIGLATLFQVEKYSYKHLLVKVVIAAVAVNFSLVIGQGVLGIADTVQNQFLPDRLSVVRALGHELMVRPIQEMRPYQVAGTAGAFSNLTYPFFLFALALSAFFTFIAILVFLVVRIVGLWVLLMVSPVAYAANVLPETTKYFEEWWNKFLSYAFLTPILAFFLNIAALFANSRIIADGAQLIQTVVAYSSIVVPWSQIVSGLANGYALAQGPELIRTALAQAPAAQIITASGVSGEIGNLVRLSGSHIVTLVFIWIGLSFAGSSSVVGAKAMTEFAKKGVKLPFKAAGGLGKWGARRGLEELHARKGIQLNPFIWKKQWDEYSHHKQEERLLRGQAKGKTLSNPMDFYETYINLPGLARLSKVARYGKAENIAKKLEQAQKEYDAAKAKMDTKGMAEAQAKKTALENQLNDVVGRNLSPELAKEYSKVIGGQIQDQETKKKNLTEDGDMLGAKEADDQAKALTAFRDELNKQIIAAGATGIINLANVEKALSQDTAMKLGADILDAKQVKDKITQQIKDINDLLAKDEKARIALHLDKNATDTDIKEAKDKAIKEKEHLDEVMSKVRRPEFYYARLARTAAEAAEEKKLSGIDDAEELKRLLQNAMHEKNAAKTGAILKKLAKDSNFNEVLEGKDLEGNKITANADGMRRLFRKIQHETSMSDSHMFQLASEVAYINEDKGWWDTARVTKLTPNGMDWADADSHQNQIFTEMGKRNSRKQAADFARLSYVEQERDEATGGWKSIALTKAGRGILKRASSNKGDMQEFQRNLRANTAAAIMGVKNWEQQLRADDISEEMIDIIKKKGGEGGITHLSGGEKFGPIQMD